VRRDHKVPFRREETIAAEALKWRRNLAGDARGYFNVVSYFSNVLATDPRLGPIALKFDINDADPPAYVTYTKQRTLHIAEEIWDFANKGDPASRYIVAHEFGHLILHDNTAQAFSDDPELRIKFAGLPEYSAENQADWFADYFLVSPTLAQSLSEDDLMSACWVTRDLAKRQIRKHTPRPPLTRATDFCPNCGDFSLVDFGLERKCTACKKRFLNNSQDI
jgi:hypothetical protein